MNRDSMAGEARLKSMRVVVTSNVEAIYGEHFSSRHAVRECVIECVELDCNRVPSHYANGYLSPEAFVAQQGA